jgi:Gpi18-like mannosyltransferase
VWAVALFPTSFLFSMVYPSALILAASVWAFLFAEEHRDLPAGALAAVATLARPNGIIVAIALALAVHLAWKRLPAILGPSAVAFGAWLLFVWTDRGSTHLLFGQRRLAGDHSRHVCGRGT